MPTAAGVVSETATASRHTAVGMRFATVSVALWGTILSCLSKRHGRFARQRGFSCIRGRSDRPQHRRGPRRVEDSPGDEQLIDPMRLRQIAIIVGEASIRR
jgi:hypothetical protein